MALYYGTKLISETIEPNSIIEDKIQDGAITENKIQDGAITENKIQNNAITRDKLNTDALYSPSIAISDEFHTYELSKDDIGKTLIYPGVSPEKDDKKYTIQITRDENNPIPLGTEIGIMALFANSEGFIKFTGNVMVFYNGAQWVDCRNAGSATFGVENGSIIALKQIEHWKKADCPENPDFIPYDTWVIIGEVEVSL